MRSVVSALLKPGCDYVSLLNLVLLGSMLLFLATGINVRVGITGYLMLLPLFLRVRIQGAAFSREDALVAAYVVLNLLWGLPVLFGAYSPVVYFKTIPYIVAPMVFYFYFSFLPARRLDVGGFLLSWVTWAVIAIAFGVWLQFFPPERYLDYLVEIEGGQILGDGDAVLRMSSYLNSTSMGLVCAVSIPAFAATRAETRGWLGAAVVIVLVIGCLLSLARASWVLLLVFLPLFVINTRTYGMGILAIGLLTLLVDRFAESEELMLRMDMILTRLSGGIGDAVTERSDQYAFAWSTFIEHPFGSGFGRFGHKSETIALGQYITDGNFHRILAELGVAGSAVFVVLIVAFGVLIVTQLAGPERTAVFAIFLGFLFVSLGSNVMDYNYTSNMFWALLGIVSSRAKQVATDRAFALVPQLAQKG